MLLLLSVLLALLPARAVTLKSGILGITQYLTTTTTTTTTCGGGDCSMECSRRKRRGLLAATPAPTAEEDWLILWTEGLSDLSYVWSMDHHHAAVQASVLVDTSGDAEGVALLDNETLAFVDGKGLLFKVDLLGTHYEEIVDYCAHLRDDDDDDDDEDNNSSCAGRGLAYWDHTFYFVDEVLGILASFDGELLTTLVTGLDAPYGVAIDKRKGRLYFTSGGNIYSTPRDARDLTPSDVDLFFAASTYGVTNVALDSQNRFVYWTGDDAIFRAPIFDPTTNVQTVYENVEGANSVAVDWQQNKLFYTCDDGVFSGDLDGTTDPTPLVYLYNATFVFALYRVAPTPAPTQLPTAKPTLVPTWLPTSIPSRAPSAPPTASPSSLPTNLPTPTPSAAPAPAPTENPTPTPTTLPSAAPTPPVRPADAPPDGAALRRPDNRPDARAPLRADRHSLDVADTRAIASADARPNTAPIAETLATAHIDAHDTADRHSDRRSLRAPHSNADFHPDVRADHRQLGGPVRPSAHWTSTKVGEKKCGRPKLAVVHFPQYHRDATNDALWGDRYTEWTTLNATADPRPLESWSPRWHGPHTLQSSGGGFSSQNVTRESMRAHLEYLERAWADDRYVRMDDRPLLILHTDSLHSDVWQFTLVSCGSRGPTPASPSRWTLSSICATRSTRSANPQVHDARHLKHLVGTLGPFAGFDNIARHRFTPHLATRIRVIEKRFRRDRPRELERMLATMAAIAGAERTQDALRSNFIAIDAWNEWGEGNVLEPNSENGFGMHEACRDYDDDRAVPDTDLISKCVVPKDARFEDNLDLDLWRVRGALAHAQLNEWRRRPLPAAVAAADASDESVERGAGMVFVIGMHKTGTMSLGLALEKLDFNVYQLQSAGAMLEKRCFQDRLYPNATDAVMFNQESRGRLLFCLKQNGVFQNATAFQDTRPSQRSMVLQPT
ncbi:hypothetical protein CTAYLR_007331 [Chrysophaeum taylorii]|uniref:Uncharacterized protein n=1 Tax=Chrysophaeum taylorii TaxID=2483200 RepID=A0AAD7UHT0_9STRA|nr:hypothetical protein CTAYLR_007331 [Chrysophaeum taylorii]